MHALIVNGSVQRYPYSFAELVQANPGTSFPAVPTDETLAQWNVYPVTTTPAPAYNPVTQNCKQINPTLQSGKWVMVWQVTSATAAETAARIRANANYPAFWDALIASTVYASIRTQSMASLPMNTLATEFIALLGDAKAGRANEAAIQASMSAVFATGTFTEDDAEEFTAALAAGLLTDIYSLT
jgi:hypothetical protein